MTWRQRYLRNRIAALEAIISDPDSSVPIKYANKQRRDAFKDLIEDQLQYFNKEMKNA